MKRIDNSEWWQGILCKFWKSQTFLVYVHSGTTSLKNFVQNVQVLNVYVPYDPKVPFLNVNPTKISACVQ